jgi:hypothetical protein
LSLKIIIIKNYLIINLILLLKSNKRFLILKTLSQNIIEIVLLVLGENLGIRKQKILPNTRSSSIFISIRLRET